MTASLTAGPPRASALWRVAGGRRYTTALAVDAVGDGLLRPFLLLYAVAVQRMPLAQAGLALSLGFVAGLIVLPFAGRRLDVASPRGPAAYALLIRAAGLLVLLTFDS